MEIKLEESELKELIHGPLWAVALTAFIWFGYLIISGENASSHAEKMATLAVEQARIIEAQPVRKVGRR